MTHINARLDKTGIGTITLAVGFTFFGSASAQITIDQSDMPSAGDLSVRWTSVLATFDDADTGPNHVWDFGTLTAQLETADTAVAVFSTPILYQFFFNNPFLYPDHDADYAVRGQDFDFQALQLTDVYEYFKRDADGFDNVGFGSNINGLPASIQRLPVDHVYEFPLDFNNTSSSFSTWQVEVPGLLFFRQEQQRDNTVDGWGTLYLPTDTFQVLRVMSVLNRNDSVFVDQFGFGFTIPEPETIEYKWLAEGMDLPVLQVNTVGGQPTTVRFWYDALSLGVPEAVATPTPTVFPNPANDLVHVRLPHTNGGQLDLCDATGRVVRSVGVPHGAAIATIDVEGLATGLYDLRLSNGSWSGKLAIDR
ncbi:MAG: T9SS type A sorting domain-containing protein [Flavobacteriales bacterium]